MERTFLIFEFNGIILHLCTCDKVKKMSLKDCLKRVYNTYNEKISEGWALFPISEHQDIEEVKKYIELGLKPVFMKYNDLRALRKVYG